MKNFAFLAASAALVMAVPSLAAAESAAAKAENSSPIAASARIADITFDLKNESPIQRQIAPQNSDALFAGSNEVKLEEFSFDLN